MNQFPALYFPETNLHKYLADFQDRACLIGRDPSADIALPDPTCSRQQFAVTRSGGEYMVEPLSRNVPTLHNGTLLAGAKNLRHNDKLTCGFTTAVYLEHDTGELRSTEATVVADISGEIGAFRYGGEIPLDRGWILGRAPGMGEIFLDHPQVSRRHAEVRVVQGTVFLHDLGSSNGTFLNGEKIRALRELRRADRVDIGPFSFTFTGHSFLPSLREGRLRVIGQNLTRLERSPTSGKSELILSDVTIVVEPREFVCILGPSGCGKSTLMKALSAREPAGTGAVFLNDESLYENFEALKRSIALVPQRDVLYESLTLEQCITFSARLRLPTDTPNDEVRRRVDEALVRVQLKPEASKPIRILSGGQKKRAALANEIVSQPDLLFLDEVTSGLDEGTDWMMMGLFKNLARKGMTIICVTHTVANVDEFCDKVVVMARPGVIAYYGSPSGAKAYFGVRNLGEVYQILPNSEGKTWRSRYESSVEFQSHIILPLKAAGLPAVSGQIRPSAQSGYPRASARKVRQQFGILTRRFFRLLWTDYQTVGIASAQSALIGFFLVMVFHNVGNPDPKQLSLLFFLGISCFWCGCNNASKEIVKERAMYRIERDVDLSVISYVASKIIVLAVFGMLQVALLFGIVAEFGTVPGNNLQQFLCMWVSVIAGTSVGLLLSSVAKTEDQASTLVPIALIPQILLSGIIVPDLPKIPDLIAHVAISGFWVYRSMKGVLSSDYGTAISAIIVLMAHAACFVSASAWVLSCDSRYGRALDKIRK